MHLHNYYSVMYTGDIEVGTPGQRFRVIFDTGSADLWLLSSKSEEQRLSFLHYYDSELSATHRANKKPFQIQYGLGTCRGFLSEDRVSLSGLAARRQVFAEVTSLTANFENPSEPMDGILGFGFKGGSSSQVLRLLELAVHVHPLLIFSPPAIQWPSIHHSRPPTHAARKQAPTLLDNLYNEGHISSRMFSFYLTKDAYAPFSFGEEHRG
jgi:hypothetical protein